MTNKLKFLLCVPAVLLVMFTYMPTGSSASEIITGFNETNTYSASGASYMNYLTATQTNVDVNDTAARQLGDEIAQRARQLCEVYGYGSGGDNWQSSSSGTTPAGRITRSSPWQSTYAGVLAEIEGADKIHLQCAGFASYCWVDVLNNSAPISQSVSGALGSWGVHGLLTTGGTDAEENYAYIIEEANPGDLIFYVDEDFCSGDAWSTDLPELAYEQAIDGEGHLSPWAHVEVYLGDGMIAGSSASTPVWKQAYIKELSTTRQMWLLRVDDAGAVVMSWKSGV